MIFEKLAGCLPNSLASMSSVTMEQVSRRIWGPIHDIVS